MLAFFQVLSLSNELDAVKIMPWYFVCLAAPSLICTAILVIASLYSLFTYFFGDDQRKKMSLGFLIISDMFLISFGHLLMHYLVNQGIGHKLLELVLTISLSVSNMINLMFMRSKMNKLKY